MIKYLKNLFAKNEVVQEELPPENIIVFPTKERARVSEEYMNTLLENKVYGIPTMEDHRGRVWPYESQ